MEIVLATSRQCAVCAGDIQIGILHEGAAYHAKCFDRRFVKRDRTPETLIRDGRLGDLTFEEFYALGERLADGYATGNNHHRGIVTWIRFALDKLEKADCERNGRPYRSKLDAD
jgi:hypothetical protein